MSGQKWAWEHDEKLRRLLNLTDGELAVAMQDDRPGCSAASIKWRRRKLGLASQHGRGGANFPGKHRRCLRCRTEFESDGDRLCKPCQAINDSGVA